MLVMSERTTFAHVRNRVVIQVVKKTKQGVRDLNHLPGKSTGKKLEPPPIVIACKHKHVKPFYGGTQCEDCGATLDWDASQGWKT